MGGILVHHNGGVVMANGSYHADAQYDLGDKIKFVNLHW